MSLPGSLFGSPGDGGGGDDGDGGSQWNGGDFESPFLAGVQGFFHGYYITGPKAVVNASVDTMVGFITLGTVDPPDLIAVDPMTDLGYNGAKTFADFGTNLLLATATAGASCTSAVGKVANLMELGNNANGAAEAIGDIAENGLSLGNAAQLLVNLVGVFVGLKFPECFPAGTPVSTEDGLKPIEDIQAGDRVWAYNLTAGEWALRPVRETYEFVSHDFVELRIDGPDGEEDKIVSTAHHPYWVIRGEELENRPRPDHITAAEEELVGKKSQLPGRWVDAVDIFPDDVVLLRDGREAVVWNVEFYQEPQKTYNFAVDDLHCYAVGELGVLVHNNCGTNSATLRKNMGGAIQTGEEAHHIVPSGHRRAQAARDILAAHGIDINDAANGVGLIASKHRGVGLHSFASIDAVTDRLRGAILRATTEVPARQQILSELDLLRDEILDGVIPGL